eukprot:jgi/Botrbrau1/5283/Bobra.0391s0004.1
MAVYFPRSIQPHLHSFTTVLGGLATSSSVQNMFNLRLSGLFWVGWQHLLGSKTCLNLRLSGLVPEIHVLHDLSLCESKCQVCPRNSDPHLRPATDSKV